MKLIRSGNKEEVRARKIVYPAYIEEPNHRD